jgi:hypothetical protein
MALYDTRLKKPEAHVRDEGQARLWPRIQMSVSHWVKVPQCSNPADLVGGSKTWRGSPFE